MTEPAAISGTPETPIYKHKTLKAKVFDLVSEHGMHEILERLADISYEQARIHDDSPQWSEIVKLLEQAQRLAETAAPVA